MNVRERLENLADLQYRQFSSKLVPGSDFGKSPEKLPPRIGGFILRRRGRITLKK